MEGDLSPTDPTSRDLAEEMGRIAFEGYQLPTQAYDGTYAVPWDEFPVVSFASPSVSAPSPTETVDSGMIDEEPLDNTQLPQEQQAMDGSASTSSPTSAPAKSTNRTVKPKKRKREDLNTTPCSHCQSLQKKCDIMQEQPRLCQRCHKKGWKECPPHKPRARSSERVRETDQIAGGVYTEIGPSRGCGMLNFK